ncbi:MAG TPA: endonuclease/exonuclease/phosphatase family protein [Verrucomicrobiota bacterium]|nr:endonuclease/exonuclease/phosphatase family protein [Verrucomicrobiota bacterium]
MVLCLGLIASLAAEPHPAGEFTVATYNVLYTNPSLPTLAATIRATGADLVALQETNARSEKYLKRELAADYPHQQFHRAQGSDGLGFLSKAPLRNLRFLDPLPKSRGAWIAEVTLGGTLLEVASVHLATPDLRQVGSWIEAVAALRGAEDLHAREIERITAALTSNRPAVVLGDFNSLPFFQAPRFMIEQGWTDSFAAVNNNPDQHGTWRCRAGNAEWKLRIDFIFHNPSLRTLESRILPAGASDHYPVVSRLAPSAQQAYSLRINRAGQPRMMAKHSFLAGIVGLMSWFPMAQTADLPPEPPLPSPRAPTRSPSGRTSEPTPRVESSRPRAAIVGHLETRDRVVTITAGPKEPLYTVRDKQGRLLHADLTARQLQAKAPALHKLVHGAYAGTGAKAGVTLDAAVRPSASAPPGGR